MVAKRKRRNPQDTTLRNNTARKKVEHELHMRIGALEQRVAALEDSGKPRAVKAAQWTGRARGSKKLVK